MADLQNGHYMKNGVRSNVLPTSDLHVLEEELSLIRCTSHCREECACQTYFYKSEDKWCSLYKYPLLENTSVSHYNGVAVYEMIGMLLNAIIQLYLALNFAFYWNFHIKKVHVY